MTRWLGYLGLLGYCAIAIIALLYWAPHFFSANTHLPMELSYRYLTASGVPIGLFAISVVARQAYMPAFSLVMLLQTVFVAGSLWCALYTFYYAPQANFFASMHLLITAASTVWNFYQYRRTLAMIARYEAGDE